MSHNIMVEEMFSLSFNDILKVSFSCLSARPEFILVCLVSSFQDLATCLCDMYIQTYNRIEADLSYNPQVRDPFNCLKVILVET